MSLINQMLRDLDQQRGPAGGAQVAALRGLGPVDNQRLRRPRILAAFGGALAVAIAVALGYWAPGKLSGQPAAVATAPGVKTPELPAAEPGQTIPAKTRLKETPGITVTDEQSVSQSDVLPGVVAESPATPQQTPAPPRLGAVASIEARPILEPSPVIDKPVAPPRAKVHTLSPEQKAERLYHRAQQALARQRAEAAVTLLERALADDPRHTAAREQLAMLMIRSQQPAQAEALLAEGLKLSPGDIEVAHAYAQLLVERGALLPALETLQHLAASHPAGAETLALQAGIMTRLQRYADAVETYRRALRQQPRQAVWWTGLGVALEHDGRAKTALDAYRRAARLPLQNPVKRFVQQRIQALSGLSAGPQG